MKCAVHFSDASEVVTSLTTLCRAGTSTHSDSRQKFTLLLFEESAALLQLWEESVCYKVCSTMAAECIELPGSSETDLQHAAASAILLPLELYKKQSLE